MAISQVQSQTNNGTGTSLNIGITGTVVGNAGIVVVGIDSAAENVESVTFNNTNITQWDVLQRHNGNGKTIEIWAATNIAASETQVTINFSASVDADAVFIEYSDVASVGTLDVFADNTGSSTTADSGTTGTTNQADEVYIAGIINDTTTSQSSPTNGFTLVAEEAGTGTQRVGAYENIVTTTGTANTSVTLGASVGWVGVIVTLREKLELPDPARIQYGSNTASGSGSSLAVTMPQSMALNGSAIIAIQFRSVDEKVTSITHTGNTWEFLAAEVGSTFHRTELWWLPNIDNTSTSITVNISGSVSDRIVIVHEYTKLKFCDIFGQAGSFSTAPDSGTTGTPATDREVYFGAIGFRNPSAFLTDPENQFSPIGFEDTGDGAGADILLTFDRYATAASTDGVAATISAGRAWNAIVAKFSPDEVRHPIEQVQFENSAGNTGALVVNLSGSPTDGNTLLAAIGIDDITRNVTSISQTGVTWELLQSSTQAGANIAHEIWIGTGVATAGSTVTINLNNSGNVTAVVVEYSGILEAVPTAILLDGSSIIASSASASVAIPTTTTPEISQDLYFVGVTIDEGTTSEVQDPENGYRFVDEISSGGGASDVRTYVYEKFAHAPSSEGFSASIESTNQEYIGSMIKLKGFISRQQRASNSGNTSALAVTLPNTPSDENLLVAQISIQDFADTVSSIVQTGATWVQADSIVNGTSLGTEIWYAENISGAATGITVNLTGSSNVTVLVQEYAHIQTSTALDQTGTSSGTSTSVSTGTTAASTQAKELWIGAIGHRNDADTQVDPDNDFGIIALEGTGDVAVYGYERFALATGTQGTTATCSSSQPFAGVIAKFFHLAPAFTFTRVQFACNDGSGSGFAVSLSSPPTNGNTLLALVGKSPDNNNTEVTSITQTGATWVRIADIGTFDNSASVEEVRGELWIARNVSGAGTNVTINFNDTGDMTACVVEYNGIDTSADVYIDRVGMSVEDQDTTSPTVRIASTRNAEELMIGLVINDDDTITQSTPTNGYTQVTTQTTNLNHRLGFYEKQVESAAEDPAFTVSLSANTEIATIIATFVNVPLAANEIGRVQYAKDNLTLTSDTVTLPQTPVNGNTLIAAFATSTNEDSIFSVSQTGAKWRKVLNDAQGNNDTATELWYAQNVSGAGTTVTVDFVSLPNNGCTAIILEYEGLLTEGEIIDQVARADANNTTPGSGVTGTPIQDDELYIGHITHSSTNNRPDPETHTSSFALIADSLLLGGSSRRGNVYEEIATTAATTGIAATMKYSGESWTASVAKFKNNQTILGGPDSIPQDAVTWRVQSASSQNTSTSTPSVTLPNTPREHHALMLVIALDSTSVTVSSVTSTGATWNFATGNANGSGPTRMEIWYATNVTSPGATINVTLSGATDSALLAAEYRGPVTLGTALDRTVSTATSSADMTTGTTATLSTSPELGIAAIASDITGIISAHRNSSSNDNDYRYVEQQRTDASYNNFVTMLDKAIIGTTAQSHNLETVSGSTANYVGALATFILQPLFDIVHTTDTLLFNEFEVSHTTDTLLFNEFEVDHTTDTLLYIEVEITHTTDTLLLATLEVDHTTDTLLDQEGSIFNTTDTSLKGEIDVTHTTNTELGPPLRDIVITNLISINTPVGENVGEFEVRLLGMSGSDIQSQNFTYNQPPQEFEVGRNQGAGITLFIKDPIVKQKLPS